MSIALGVPDENRPVTAFLTVSIMPPFVFPAFPFELFARLPLLPLAVVFLARAVFEALDCLAPPAAVRLPAAPLLLAVDDLDLPERDAVADREPAAFEAAFLLVPADLDAPVLLAPEPFDAVLFFAPPDFAAADLFPFWLDFEDELEAVFLVPPDVEADFVPEEREPELDFDLVLVELVAVAIVYISK